MDLLNNLMNIGASAIFFRTNLAFFSIAEAPKIALY